MSMCQLHQSSVRVSSVQGNNDGRLEGFRLEEKNNSMTHHLHLFKPSVRSVRAVRPRTRWSLAYPRRPGPEAAVDQQAAPRVGRGVFAMAQLSEYEPVQLKERNAVFGGELRVPCR